MSFLVELAGLAVAVGVFSLQEEVSAEEVGALAAAVVVFAVTLFTVAALSYLPILTLTFFGGSAGLAWANWLFKGVLVLWIVWMRLGMILIAATIIGVTLVGPACAVVAAAIRRVVKSSDVLQGLGALILLAALAVTAREVWEELVWLWEDPSFRASQFIFEPLGDAMAALSSDIAPLVFLTAIVGGLFLLIAAGIEEREREERAQRGGRREIRIERREGPPKRKKERKAPPPRDRPVMLPDGNIRLPDGTLVRRPKKAGVKQ